MTFSTYMFASIACQVINFTNDGPVFIIYLSETMIDNYTEETDSATQVQ